MQYKTAFGLYRAAVKHGRLRQVLAMQGQLNFFKQLLKADVAGFIDNQTQCTALRVFTHVNHAFGKHGVFQTGHGDQKVVCEVDRI